MKKNQIFNTNLDIVKMTWYTHIIKYLIKTYQNWSFRLELGDPQWEGAQSATKDFKDDFSVIFAAILQFIWLGFAHKVASSVK